MGVSPVAAAPPVAVALYMFLLGTYVCVQAALYRLLYMPCVALYLLLLLSWQSQRSLVAASIYNKYVVLLLAPLCGAHCCIVRMCVGTSFGIVCRLSILLICSAVKPH